MHDHQHSHHSHQHGTHRALVWALVLNGSFLIVEGAAGLMTGSLALLSDAVHMLSDVGALLLALIAARLATRGAALSRTFGLRRAEVLGGFLNGITQLAACAYIVWEAIQRLSAPPDVPGWPILIVGIVGLAINLGSAWALYRADNGSLNVRGALIHMLADALGSVGAILAAGLVLVGIPLADPLVSLLIAGLVLWGTWGLLRDAARVLLQLPPVGLDVERLTQLLLDDEAVTSIHDVHAWTLDGQSSIVSAHIRINQLDSGEQVRRRLAQLLQAEMGIEHLTLQLESEEHGCALSGCGVAGAARG